MSYAETWTAYDPASFIFDSSKVSFISNIELKFGGSGFPTTNPKVTTQFRLPISSLVDFITTETNTANTAITYQLILNGNTYWWNPVTARWGASDGTYAQSSPQTDISTNAPTLFSDLALLGNQFLGLNIFLHTSNTSETPVLIDHQILYTWDSSSASAINQCVVSGYLSDLAGSIPLPTALRPVELLVMAPYGFFHGTNFVEPFTKAFAFSVVDGSLTASIIETETPGVKLTFSLTYYDGDSLKSTQLFNATVPNAPSVSLSNLSSPVPYDFG